MSGRTAMWGLSGGGTPALTTRARRPPSGLIRIMTGSCRCRQRNKDPIARLVAGLFAFRGRDRGGRLPYTRISDSASGGLLFALAGVEVMLPCCASVATTCVFKRDAVFLSYLGVCSNRC